MSNNGGRAEGASSSHRSSPIPRGPPTPTSTSPFSEAPRSGQSILAGRYTIGPELGRGSNGRVFKAFDQEEGRFVAVKQISLAGVSREQLNGVVGEIDLLKNLDHENIVQYYDSIKTNNHLYIILEYMESGSLAGVIKQTNYGVFSERWVALYVAQVLKGLKYLHAQGVVHRDIKGANILTTKDMVIKLADFGVAAKLADRGSKGTEESAKNVAGSPYWMAPEVIELSSVTTAADIWSIGCLIVELLTGSAPYFECQPMSALFRIVQDKHPPLPQGISDSLRSFLLSCFIKDPHKRPTAEDLLRDDWICENQDRIPSPSNKAAYIPPPSSAPSTASSVPLSRDSSVVKRIFQHQSTSRTSKPFSSEPSSEVEQVSPRTRHRDSSDGEGANQGMSPERAESPPFLSRVSSAAGNEISPVELTDVEEGYEQTGHPSSGGDKSRKGSTSNPQSSRSSVERSQTRQDLAESTSHSRSKKEWREEGPPVDRETTSSTLMVSGTSSPDTRMHSPSAANKEESALTAIFSERIYEFESGIHRSRTRDNWGLYSNSQPVGYDTYDPLNVQKVLLSLHPHLPLASILRALPDLINLIRRDVEAKSTFIHADGLLTLLELLLQFNNHGVIEHTLLLSNCVCGEDAVMLKDAAAVGLAAEIFKFAQSSYPLTVRKYAAQFLQAMSFASIKSRDSLIQCQGLRYLVVLLEDGERKSLELKEIALSCLGHILDEHGTIEGKVLRMLCMADLPKRLISALSAVHQNCSQLSLGVTSPAAQEQFLTSTTSLTRRSSADSLSEQNIPGTPSERSSASERRRPASEAAMSESNHPETSGPSGSNRPPPLQSFTDKTLDLLQKICEAESEVHGHLFRSGTLQEFLQLLRLPQKEVTHRVTICLKHLSQKPTVLEHLQEVDTVAHLIPLLGQRDRSEMMTMQIQREALIVIDTICRCNPEWKDKAVGQGIVPYLCMLSRPAEPASLTEARPDEGAGSSDETRKYSVPLLCRLLMHASPNTRQTFWEHDVANLFLELLEEERWHQIVLDALATWLEEDIHQIEDKLMDQSSVQTFTTILRGYRYRSSNEISAVLDPLLRMLIQSDRVSRSAGLYGLAQVILDMLKEADAGTSLRLLKCLRRVYGMHPRPKEFINRYNVQQQLDHLANSATGASAGDARVLVRKEALDLLTAFQMNQIW